MKQAKKNENDLGTALKLQLGYRLREGTFILMLSLAVFFILALTTFNMNDPGWSHTGEHPEVVNAGGPIGAWFADVLLSLFGYLAYGFPMMIALGALVLFLHRHQKEPAINYPLLSVRLTGFAFALLAGCALASIYFGESATYPLGPGGILGLVSSDLLLRTLHPTGSTLLLLTAFLVGVTFATGLSWLKLMDFCGRYLLQMMAMSKPKLASLKDELQQWWHNRKKTDIHRDDSKFDISKFQQRVPDKHVFLQTEPTTFDSKVKLVKKKNTLAAQTPLFKSGAEGDMPSLSLLDVPVHKDEAVYTDETLQDMSRQVESKLSDFNVKAQVVAVHPGPVITRFELQLAPGIKASKITGLAKDLARSLAVVSVRVVEIIPGKPYVGLELPNAYRQSVYLSEVLGSEAYQKASSPLALALGNDIAGKPVVVDLSKMPHLLVAGTTGAGKSVGLNAMLLSILFKATPDEVRLIMIDPKMLELSVYDEIPHLLAPVVTDMKEAANALKWCVAEMERRYRIMAALGVRNLVGYNRKIEEAEEDNKPIVDPLFEPMSDDDVAPNLMKLPYVVVVVDEFADMIMVVGKKVEELIARIAQKARAAGIHLILATQRPSVDVITGLIKANVPSRIAFQVASRIDSRTILDQQGAEQLLGRGDMLYLPVGAGICTRIHGAFVSDQEVHAVVKDWKSRGEPDYLEEIVNGSASLPNLSMPEIDEENIESDPLYDQAVQVVIESRKASISMVQRRLKVGYNRAARLIEQMEAAGLVSAMQSNGTREILIPPSH